VPQLKHNLLQNLLPQPPPLLPLLLLLLVVAVPAVRRQLLTQHMWGTTLLLPLHPLLEALQHPRVPPAQCLPAARHLLLLLMLMLMLLLPQWPLLLQLWSAWTSSISPW
jgi:hypothetical protein